MMSKRQEYYMKCIKDELKANDVRVYRWGEFDRDATYLAYFESRRVFIPKPTTTYPFLIGLHEIGHIVKGDRMRNYLEEYHAETWAIRTARKKYGVRSKIYEASAKRYVYHHIVEDVIFFGLPISSVRKSILKWVGKSERMLRKDVARRCARIEKQNQSGEYDYIEIDINKILNS